MNAHDVDKEKIILEISKEELGVICNALNEVCNGIEIWEFETRLGIKLENARILLDNLISTYKKNVPKLDEGNRD